MAARLTTLTGAKIAAALPAVSRLRVAVFRAWPYLYEGSLDYEQDYLVDFSRAVDSCVVTAMAGGEIVGAATAAPVVDHSPEFVPLFAARGFDPERVFYFGESVLLPAWRGQGLGRGFFDHREAHARICRNQAGRFTHAAFCAVIRAADDPRRPADYVPLDAFWRRRGFAPVEGLVGAYSWQQIGDVAETTQPMQFWMKTL